MKGEGNLSARSTTGLIVAVAAAVLAWGCGGGSSQLSKAEFVKQANAACSKERAPAVEEATNYMQQHGSEGKPVPVVFANMVKTVMLPVYEAELEALAALDGPAAQEKSIAKFTQLERAEMKEVESLSRVASFEAVEAHFIPSAKIARANGLTNCANGPEPVS